MSLQQNWQRLGRQCWLNPSMRLEHFQPAMQGKASLRMQIKSVEKTWPGLLKVVVDASRDAQIHMVLVDTVGICDFAQTGFGAPDGTQNVLSRTFASA